jgi:hypothetical protein
MKKFNYTQLVTIINQEKVVNWLNLRGKSELANKVDDISYMIGHKGERFPEYVLIQTIREIVGDKLTNEIECDIIQMMGEPKDLYFIGILSHDVKIEKKESKLNLVK